MSLGQFLMAGGWLLAANLRTRALHTLRHPVFLLPAMVFLIQLAGLWNTNDLTWGLHDLRIKLPIILLPLFLVAGPGLDQRFKELCLRTLFAGVLVVSFVGIYQLLTGQVTLHDFRSMSPFISHIRLSLLLVFCIAALVLMLISKKTNRNTISASALALWFLTYLFLLQSLTGLTILAILVLAGAAYLSARAERLSLKIPMLLLLTAGGISGVLLVRYIMVDSLQPTKPKIEDLKTCSALGSPYRNEIDQVETENGRFVWTEYSENELDSGWALRSNTPLQKTDSSGRFPLATLMRYLTYLGYSKDLAGLSRLTDAQIHDIEMGYATPLHANPQAGLFLRIKELAREYRIYHYTGFAQGHTFAQRLEYQRAALYIIRHHPWTGVGTGDLPTAYGDAYEQIKSTLEPAWRLRAHNQYLSLGVANGLGAMAWMVLTLLFLLIRSIRKGLLLQAVFLIIAACSFITEDTLETQAGVTFFAFLCCALEGWGFEFSVSGKKP